MSKTQEALKLALENAQPSFMAPGWTLVRNEDITAIREALAERCVCGEPDTPGTHRTDGPCLAEPPAQQQDLPDFIAGALGVSRGTAYDLMREALAGAQQQEPVYWQWRRKDQPWSLEYTFNSEVQVTTKDSERRALYTSQPASKPWVGLTNEERKRAIQFNNAHEALAVVIEAKLREKNA